MATTTRVLDANVNGAVYTSNANAALEALDTCHSGATAPTDEVANGKLWLDTSTTPGVLKVYNNAAWTLVQSGPNVTATGAFTSLGIDDNAAATAVTIDASGKVGIGTASPSRLLHVSGSGTGTRLRVENTTGSNVLDVFAEDGGNSTLNYSSVLTMSQSGSERMRIDASGKVGIGTASPSDVLHVVTPSFGGITLECTGATADPTFKFLGDSGNYWSLQQDASEADSFQFRYNNSEKLRIDSSGNLLVNGTVTNPAFSNTANQISLRGAVGTIEASRDGGAALELNRKTSDGNIATFRKDGTTVGSIGSQGGLYLYMGSTSNTDTHTAWANGSFKPSTATGSNLDNTLDCGNISARWDDIYATNGTIQTSDRNEKEAIASLTSTEMLVAARLSSSFKNFKWKDSVAEKGLEAARMHSGIIAQDVQDAFAAEGLDASDYAMFISSAWWETQTYVPAVEAVAEVVDEEGNVVTEAVEAKEAYTRTDTYDTLEEAPEGATERTRLGVRYPELLAFVAAYSDQRFLTIEARLAALEA